MKDGPTRVAGPIVDSDCFRSQLMMMESTQYVSANRPQAKENNSDQPIHPNSPHTPPSLSSFWQVLLPSLYNFRLLRRGPPGIGDIPYGTGTDSASWLPPSSKPLSVHPSFASPCSCTTTTLPAPVVNSLCATCRHYHTLLSPQQALHRACSW